MKPPPDYNPHIHGNSPRTRVEHMAWANRDSASINVRQAAATILVMAGCLNSHHHAVVQCGSFMARHTRRRVIAHHAWKLRHYLHGWHPNSMAQGNRTFTTIPVHEVSASVEAQNEGRIMPRGRPNPHD